MIQPDRTNRRGTHTNQSISSFLVQYVLPLSHSLIPHLFSWKRSDSGGPSGMCSEAEYQLQHLSSFRWLLWQPELLSGAVRCPRGLIRADKGDSRRPTVVTAAGTSCLARAGWRPSAGAVVQAVKRNISIYLPTNYRISFKHQPARTCSPALPGPWPGIVFFFFFPLLITLLISDEYLIIFLDRSLARIGTRFLSRYSLLPQKCTRLLFAWCLHWNFSTSCLYPHASCLVSGSRGAYVHILALPLLLEAISDNFPKSWFSYSSRSDSQI